ncbi:hypothetical protein CXF83_21455 [Shewanella sp. Choline-02u-19]|nr:VCBS domain-containing protein [Shewanella sp. Choline-02u-19]PKI29094.1 hypothetical protein CXF83_21455 [Shewanella sp. Choline-02u-19]
MVDALASGETHDETFLVTVTDEFGAFSTQIVTVTVTGTNDIPLITSTIADATGEVLEAGVSWMAVMIQKWQSHPRAAP